MKAVLRLTVLENPWIPQTIKDGLTPKQAEFLVFEGREALYGGSAGGGKSVALLIAALQYIEQPGYGALILRRTYKQLAKNDSILNKSKEWLWGKKTEAGEVKWNGEERKWTFPNGNTLEFGHMEHEDSKFDYQGGDWHFIGVDECTQFTDSMLAYPRTRQRRIAGSKIPIRWRGASNPGNISHEYIKARYVKTPEGESPCTPQRQFFPASIEDNPNLDREAYIESLVESGIDALTLKQLLKGDWDAVSGGRFLPEWFRYFKRNGDYIILQHAGTERLLLPKDCTCFFTVDPAASEKTTADYTVISVWMWTPSAELLWWDCLRVQKEIPDIVPIIQQMCNQYRPSWVAIEAVGANSGVLQLANRAVNPPIVTRALTPLSKDKLVRATQAMYFVQSGRLWLPAPPTSFPTEDVKGELVRFTGNDKVDSNDDIVDTLSYAVQSITEAPSKQDILRSGPRMRG